MVKIGDAIDRDIIPVLNETRINGQRAIKELKLSRANLFKRYEKLSIHYEELISKYEYQFYQDALQQTEEAQVQYTKVKEKKDSELVSNP